MNKNLWVCLILCNFLYAPEYDNFNDIFKINSDVDYAEMKRKSMQDLLAEARAAHMKKNTDGFADDILGTSLKKTDSSLLSVEQEETSGVPLRDIHERYPSDTSVSDVMQEGSKSFQDDAVKDFSQTDQPTGLHQDPFLQNLDSLYVSRDYQSFEPMVDAVLHKNELLIEQGFTPSGKALDQALKTYENFVVMSQIEGDVPTLNQDLDRRFKVSWWKTLAIRFMKTDTQKTIQVQEMRIASKLAQNVFVLDDALPKSVITPEQRDKIAKLEIAYKKPWQRARSWWMRLWKK